MKQAQTQSHHAAGKKRERGGRGRGEERERYQRVDKPKAHRVEEGEPSRRDVVPPVHSVSNVSNACEGPASVSCLVPSPVPNDPLPHQRPQVLPLTSVSCVTLARKALRLSVPQFPSL